MVYTDRWLRLVRFVLSSFWFYAQGGVIYYVSNIYIYRDDVWFLLVMFDT